MGGAYRPFDNQFKIVVTRVRDSMTDLIGIPYAGTRRRVNAAFLFCKVSGRDKTHWQGVVKRYAFLLTSASIVLMRARSTAAAMLLLSGDRDKRTTMSISARHYAEKHFSNKRMLNAYLQLFEMFKK